MGALIRLPRPSPFAYPGGNPGFDPSHVAANEARFSAVSVGGNFIDVLSGMPGTITGTPAAKIDSAVGKCLSFSSTQGVAFSGSPVVTDTTLTFASIIRGTGSGVTGCMLSANGPSNLSWFINGTPSPHIYASGGATDSTVLAANTPYFLAGSISLGASNFVSVNLLTGKTVVDTTSGVGNTIATSGTFTVGNLTTANPFLGEIAAVMYSGAFMSQAQLLQWAQDPWSFWYP